VKYQIPNGTKIYRSSGKLLCSKRVRVLGKNRTSIPYIQFGLGDSTKIARVKWVARSLLFRTHTVPKYSVAV